MTISKGLRSLRRDRKWGSWRQQSYWPVGIRTVYRTKGNERGQSRIGHGTKTTVGGIRWEVFRSRNLSFNLVQYGEELGILRKGNVNLIYDWCMVSVVEWGHRELEYYIAVDLKKKKCPKFFIGSEKFSITHVMSFDFWWSSFLVSVGVSVRQMSNYTGRPRTHTYLCCRLKYPNSNMPYIVPKSAIYDLWMLLIVLINGYFSGFRYPHKTISSYVVW